MMFATTDTLPGHRIERYCGLVQGSTVRAKHVGRDIMAGLKNIVGGELKGYTELLQESRDSALQRMATDAEALGANAIIALRVATAAVAPQAAEVLVYGTAVVVRPE